MLWMLAGAALAGWPEDGSDRPFLEHPGFLHSTDPAAPGALARSSEGALLPAGADERLPLEPIAHIDGWPMVDGIAALGAQAWHDAGYRGQGVKVAVFDLQWTGFADWPDLHLDATHDCFAHPSCEVQMDPGSPRFAFEQGDHGVGCAQIIAEVAPDAELHAVRVNGLTTFQAAADWAIENDIDLISMSMSFFNSSFYDGSGPFARVVDRLQAAGVVLVTSSGNYARQHWTGPWLDVDGDGTLDFDDPRGLPISFRSAGAKQIYVNWDEWFDCGRSDLWARVVDDDGRIWGRSDALQHRDETPCSPIERLTASVPEEGGYWLQIGSERVAESWLEVDVQVLSGTVVDGEPYTSMADPSPHPWAFVVGAVFSEGYLGNDIERFSSQGPVRGGAAKPDIAGPDGVTVAQEGLNGFFGTSAATPAVAGAVALVMSREPELTAFEATQKLKAWAFSDQQGRYDDPRWGAGKARLPLPDADVGCTGTPTPTWGWVLLPLLLWRRRR